MSADEAPLLDVRRLGVSFSTPGGEVEAVRDFSLQVRAGECVGVVGESGAGKSQAFLSIMGLLPPAARVCGSARFDGQELLGRPASELNRIRGAQISMVFQDPLAALTPHMRIGAQIAEALIRHSGVSRSVARSRALELLARVHISDPARRLDEYPHELSGGMRQRVMLAIALACDPRLVIADEPTTALDVTIQAQILSLLARARRERGLSLVLITHDFGTIAGLADRVIVMQAGRIVESGPVASVLKRPDHAYTRALLNAVPCVGKRVGDGTSTPELDGRASVKGSATTEPAVGDPVLAVTRLRVRYAARTRRWHAADAISALEGVDVALRAGEALGVVGESGSGKSTLARAILRLLRPTAGQVVWLGRAVEAASAAELRPLRRALQLVFQDPLASLDPRMTVRRIVAEPLRVHRPDLDSRAREQAAADMLLRVGLGRTLLSRYPHELSGGQAQRVGIARAMVLKPAVLVCDEPVSALDVSVQAQVLSLLQDLKREYGTAILFISHNLAVVRELCERVLVLYLGRRMEEGATHALYDSPAHPYTRSLVDAVPLVDPDLQPARLADTPLAGEQPSPVDVPPGCVFHTRCPHARHVCTQEVPKWEPTPAGHVACHRWREILRGQ